MVEFVAVQNRLFEAVAHFRRIQFAIQPQIFALCLTQLSRMSRTPLRSFPTATAQIDLNILIYIILYWARPISSMPRYSLVSALNQLGCESARC